MITPETFSRGITLVQDGTGTRFNWNAGDTWRTEFLKDIPDDAWVDACRKVARRWEYSRFPSVSEFVKELEGETRLNAIARKQKQDARLALEQEQAQREFEADLAHMKVVLDDMPPKEKIAFEAQIKALTEADGHWRWHYDDPQENKMLKAGWDNATRLHLLEIRRYGWLDELEGRIVDK